MVLRAHSSIVLILAFTLAGFAVALTAHAQEATPATPDISPTDPMDDERWYRTPPSSFEWSLPADVSAVAVGIGTSTDFEPTFVYEPPIRRYTLDTDEINEGVQYVSVQFRNENGWGEIAHYPVRIDRTPPRDLSVRIVEQYAATSTVVFAAHDELSGVAGYSLHINDYEPIYISAEQGRNGFSFRHDTPGQFDVRVFAYDHAGNSTAISFPVFILDESVRFENNLWFGAYTDEDIALFGLSIAALFALWYAFRTRRYYRRREQSLREEMTEVHDEMTRIFKALRDEIRDQVKGIRARKRMSKGEQQVVENLSNVLDVSKTLVDKEMKDVRKILDGRR